MGVRKGRRRCQIRAAIYLRVSSDEQAQHGYSIGAQRKECRQRAERLGADEVVEFSDEGISASLLDRPGLNALRAAIRNGETEIVVIYDPDRFARNLSHQLLVTEEIEKAGVRLEFVNFEWKNTPEGKLFYSLRGAIAEYEREKIRLRTMSGRTQKAREGKLPFAAAPLGYDYDPQTSQITVNETEAAIVRRIFREYLVDGTGINGIAWELTNEGVPTRKGAGAWYRQVVWQILSNPVYMGVYYANRRDMTGVSLNRFRPAGEKARIRERDRTEWIPVAVPALMTADEWLAVQQRIKDRADHWARARSIYLLSGLLRCGLCGQTMTGRRGRNWGKPVREYTCYKNNPGVRPGCGHRVNADEIEEGIWQRVLEWLHNPELLADQIRPAADTTLVEAEIARQEKDLEKVRNSQREILSVLERGLLPADDVLDSLNRLKRRESALLQSLEELRLTLGAAGQQPADRAVAVEAAKRWLARIEEDLPVQKRQQIVRQFITGVTAGHDTLTVRARVPASRQGEEPAVEGVFAVPVSGH